jgi:hypothetical protein
MSGVDDCNLTIRCPCGTYIRITQIYPVQAVTVAQYWLTKHSACTSEGEPHE